MSLDLLAERGAILSGHFLLTSGKHSDTYVEKARMLEEPRLVMRFAEQMAGWHEDAETVISPAVGAIPLGFAVALAADARFVFAERQGRAMTLRRGFGLGKGERVLIVEDVVTTGGSAAEVWDLVRGAGAQPVGVAAMVDRSIGRLPFPLRALVRLTARVYDSDECPLCANGVPIESHGSRGL